MSHRILKRQPSQLLLRSIVIIGLLTCWSARDTEAAPPVMTNAATGASLQQIISLRKAKLYLRARRTAQTLLTRRPLDAQCHVAMAEVLRDMGQTAEALKEYTRAFHLKPNMIEALVPLCELRLKSADRELGLSYARMAVLAAPQSVQVRRTLIEALIATDRLEEADKELSPMLSSGNPDMLVLAYQLSRKRRDLVAARHYLDEAIRVTPKDAKLLMLRADLFEAVDDCKGALDSLEQAIALEPKSIEARTRLASHLENHDLEFLQAQREYQEVLKLDPKNIQAICGNVRCQSKSKDTTLQVETLVKKKLAGLMQSFSQGPRDLKH